MIVPPERHCRASKGYQKYMAPVFGKERVLIAGIAIDALTAEEACQCFDALIDNGGSSAIMFCEANLLVQATRSHDIRRALESASLVLADGVSITLASYLIGKPLPARLPGPSVMPLYCKHGVGRGLNHFFYGGAPGETERLADNLSKQIPGLRVAGTYSPPFRPLTEEEDLDVKKRIEESSADVLWVGLGAPKQELWITEHLDRIRVPLMLGVGAAFDFHSGTKPWAPKLIRVIGLEWAWRMFITGGPRIFQRGIDVLPAFIHIIFRDAVLHHWRRFND